MEEISKLLETFFIADLNNQADLAETVQQARATFRRFNHR